VDRATAVLLLAGWASGLVLLWRLPTPRQAGAGAARVGDVVVVVPARDEAATLPDLLASIARQTVQPREVVVVDDSSSDGTAAVAAAHGARVVDAGEPPPGWLGKPWACSRGVETSRGEVIVLLDADVRLGDDGLREVLAAASRLAPDGLLSVQPHHLVERPYEHLSAFCNIVPVMASAIGAPGQRRATLAFGPCLVTTREALQEVGGFPSVRGSVVEDVALARVYAAAARPVRCLVGGDSVGFRMYGGGVRALVQGWTKNLATGATSAPPAATIGAVLWVAATVATAVEVGSAGLGWLLGDGPPGAVVVGAYAVTAAQVWWVLRRLGSFRWWSAALFPVPLAAFVALFARSALHRVLRRRVSWRGRSIDVRPAGG